MKLCKFKNILGIPAKGIHFHVFNIAIIDVFFTFIGAWFITKILLKYNYKVNYYIVLILLFLLGIILHKLFCVDTTINKLIFSK